eukprot:m.18463 g.18463  ORF g.18463 m.18463 type:complete len:56 (+) comp6313_c0_seq2:318-485(+)
MATYILFFTQTTSQAPHEKLKHEYEQVITHYLRELERLPSHKRIRAPDGNICVLV